MCCLGPDLIRMGPLKLFTGYHGISQAEMHHSINDGVYCYHSWTANWNRTVGRWKPDVHIIFRYSHPGPATMVGRIMFFWHGHGIAKFLNATIYNDFQGRVNSQDFREGILSKAKKRAHIHTHDW